MGSEIRTMAIIGDQDMAGCLSPFPPYFHTFTPLSPCSIVIRTMDLGDSANYLASDGVVETAVDAGWYARWFSPQVPLISSLDNAPLSFIPEPSLTLLRLLMACPLPPPTHQPVPIPHSHTHRYNADSGRPFDFMAAFAYFNATAMHLGPNCPEDYNLYAGRRTWWEGGGGGYQGIIGIQGRLPIHPGRPALYQCLIAVQ